MFIAPPWHFQRRPDASLSMAHPAPSPILVAVLVQALFSGLFYRSFIVCRKMVKYTVLQLTDG